MSRPSADQALDSCLFWAVFYVLLFLAAGVAAAYILPALFG